MSDSSVLAVHTDGRRLINLARMLEAAGYRVMAAHGFPEARAALGLRPDAVVTALQLGDFNGLHLVINGRALDPGLVAVVIDAGYDAGREADATSLDTAYLVEPVRPGPALALLSELIGASTRGMSIRPSSQQYRERRVGDRRRCEVFNFVPERRRRDRRHSARS
jgi:DNA-binding NtrC family response regulator